MHESQSSHSQTPPLSPLNPQGAGQLFPWATWKNTILLTLVIFLVRLAYLYFLNPFELAGDEAQYWDWSRHLSWSYFTKGPGVAWTIFASTSLLGSTPWAVRLPALIAFAIIMLTIAKLTSLIANRDPRPGFFAATLVALCPPFYAAGQLMTIDEPFFACWALSALFAYKAFDNQRNNKSPFIYYQLIAFAIGIGFLYKYTILLIIPGLILFALIKHKQLHTFKPKNILPLIPAFIIFLIAISPVFIWNAQNDWITVKHLVGHLGVQGGDRIITEPEPRFTVQKLLLNPLEMIGTQIGFFGIPLLILTIISFNVLRKHRNDSPNQWLDTLFLLYVAAPIFIFYFLVAFLKKVQPNWPVAGMLTLLPIAALPAIAKLNLLKSRTTDWIDAKKQGKKPKIHWRENYIGTIIWGSIAIILISFIPYVSLINPDFPGIRRITGFRADAALVQKQIELTTQQTGQTPIIITDNYQKTARLAFYLPTQPTVFCAQYYYGERPTDYDRFADTDLKNPDLKGRTAILIGLDPEKWQQQFKFSTVTDSKYSPTSPSQRIMVGSDFQGPINPPSSH